MGNRTSAGSRKTRDLWRAAALILAGAIAPASTSSPPSAAEAGTPAAAAPVTVLKAARLFDGRSDRLVSDAVVIVEGSRIREVGSRLKPPSGARVIDLGDATLLPGFIDSHTHLAGEMSDNWLKDTVDGLRRTLPEASIRSAEHARRTLLAGFTTVRDLGAGDFIDIGLRDAIRAGVTPGPRILASGGGLGARGGHCDETGFPYLRFGSESGVPNGIASGADPFRDAVRFRVKYGADVIKICATGGVLSLADEVDTPQLSQAEMDAIVEEAHRLRKKVAAHAHGAEGAKVAVRAGVDSIEHGSFLDEEALRMMKERGTWFVPTLMAVETVSGKGGAREFPPEIAAKAKAAADAHAAAMRKAIEMGVKIAFGTDSGVSPHGLNAREFALLVERGLTPAAALRTGTSAASELLGLQKEIGTLEPGKEADILAVPRDPLADIHQTEKVMFVMKGGAVHRHDSPGSR